ncbi:DUF397 domain-containing protein [Streptomyces sp. NPDC017979]|uniref:DUF397 domain-containing protein n=1 Tax=Streptomyces sp. NPDC017979 TaxID=3365024 RepID=UPI0037B95B83
MTNGQAPQLNWFKSSHSGSEGGACVEVAANLHTVHVRDSKNRGGAQLSFTSAAWGGFIAGQAAQPSWHKSSYSSGEGGECVEVATNLRSVRVRDSKEPSGPHLTIAPHAWVTFITDQATQHNWRKSSHSGGDGGECVEVAANPHTVHVRDSKNRGGAQLSFTSAAWGGFIAGQGARPDGFSGPARD